MANPAVSQNIVELFPLGSYTMEWLRADELKVDHRYQRPPKPHTINKIATTFDPDLFGALIVSVRFSGDRVLLDGQQRIAALNKMHWGDQKVPCMTLRNLTLEQEAKIFKGIQINRIAVQPLELWKADLFAKDPEALAIKKVLDGLGLHVATSGGTNAPDKLRCIKTIRELHERLGSVGLHRVMRVLKQAFTDGDAWDKHLVYGMGLMLARYPDVSDEKLIRRLARFQARALLHEAMKMKGGLSENISSYTCFTLVNAYNKGLTEKDKLPVVAPSELGNALRGLRNGMRLRTPNGG